MAESIFFSVSDKPGYLEQKMGKLSAVRKETSIMDLSVREDQNLLRAGLTEAYLLRLNRYAYETGLIGHDIYLKMTAKIKSEAIVDQILRGG